jgi:Family of unknown function (DUF5771)
MRAIMRSGYVAHRKAKVIRVKATVTKRGPRKGYTYKSKGGPVRVKAVPIKDVGAAGKGPKVIGKLKAGMLTKYHYHPVETITARHRALTKAVRVGREDPHQVVKRLTAISTLTKRTLPNASRIYKRDAKWVHARWASKFGSKA